MDEHEVTHLVGMDKPVDRSGLECPVTVWDNNFVEWVEMVRDSCLLRLHAGIQCSLLALPGILQ